MMPKLTSTMVEFQSDEHWERLIEVECELRKTAPQDLAA